MPDIYCICFVAVFFVGCADFSEIEPECMYLSDNEEGYSNCGKSVCLPNGLCFKFFRVALSTKMSVMNLYNSKNIEYMNTFLYMSMYRLVHVYSTVQKS